MEIGVVSLFPDLVRDALSHGIPGRALASGAARLHLADPRTFATDRHRPVDDRTAGGGPGMVLMAPPVTAAARSLPCFGIGPCLVLDPAGRRLDQASVRSLAEGPGFSLICGRYEGLDERILDILRAEPVSVGDLVVSGGEVPALMLIDAVLRLLPGVLGDPESHEDDSFGEDGLLGFPLFTRPVEVEGRRIPDVLLSGNHQKIAAWRRREQLLRTRERRPDLFASARLRPSDLKLLSEPDSDGSP